MNIVIIEDERLLADELERNIRKLVGASVCISQIHSVSDGIAYFKTATLPDLILSDIQLGDGKCFDILATLKAAVPVIFCTAYDEQAFNPFPGSQVDYILKPFTCQMLLRVLTKYM
ncbi:LytR/AlgR family response regulator transcription factor [Dyadobacter subterraneus]|uniref:Response regulator n=1 Tax=Dyadobacter subterraneus TaxID=2773304 RepID=A0ABR9W948_9BACT|nr:response regulator [Dyadobacter subterraneus]MBE9461997.1 response regulator [Dyadobacter subterraneus]